MQECVNSARFADLPAAEQHTVQTYIDELARRDTLVDTIASPRPSEQPRESLVYAIPSAESDTRAALRVLQSG